MYPKLEQRNREYEIFRQNEIPMFPFVNSCVSSKKKNSHYTAKVTLEVANISVKNLLLVTCLPAYQINLEKKKNQWMSWTECERTSYNLMVILLTM